MFISEGKNSDSSSGSAGMSEDESGDMESAMEEARHEDAYELFQREGEWATTLSLDASRQRTGSVHLTE
jgi:hypothetical protein